MPRANREATTASAGAATKRPSPKKPHSTASASFAPNVPEDDLPAEETVRSCKSLSRVERAFRSCRSVDLLVRPVYHRLESRVRAHVFLCRLACHVEWHMRRSLATLLFDDHEPPEDRSSPRGPQLAGRTGAQVPSGNQQGQLPPHRRRIPRPQLPDPARRPRHTHTQPRYACTAPAAPPSISSPDPRHCRAKPSDCCECVPDRRKVPSTQYPVACNPDSGQTPVAQGLSLPLPAELRSEQRVRPQSSLMTATIMPV